MKRYLILVLLASAFIFTGCVNETGSSGSAPVLLSGITFYKESSFNTVVAADALKAGTTYYVQFNYSDVNMDASKLVFELTNTTKNIIENKIEAAIHGTQTSVITSGYVTFSLATTGSYSGYIYLLDKEGNKSIPVLVSLTIS